MSYKSHMDACERDLLVETIGHLEDDGVVAGPESVALRLGIAPSTVFRKFRQHGIRRVEGRYTDRGNDSVLSKNDSVLSKKELQSIKQFLSKKRA